jgi:hypothetical protein
MSRYESLAQFLAAKKADIWEASFEDVERRLGAPLPKSAFKYPAWWANQNGPGHSQTHGWRSVGWRTSAVDLQRRRVRFERDRAGESVPTAAGPDDSLEQLFQRAHELSGIAERERPFA